MSLGETSAETRSLLLTLTLGLSGLRIKDRRVIKTFATELHAMGENTFLEVLRDMAREEIGEQALERGRVAQSRRYILHVLTRRFGSVSPDVEHRLGGILKVEVLDILHDEAVFAPTLADFELRLASLES